MSVLVVGGWTRWLLKVPPNLNHPMVLWFYCDPGGFLSQRVWSPLAFFWQYILGNPKRSVWVQQKWSRVSLFLLYPLPAAPAHHIKGWMDMDAQNLPCISQHLDKDFSSQIFQRLSNAWNVLGGVRGAGVLGIAWTSAKALPGSAASSTGSSQELRED